ncbi:MAG TPA: M20/M25/M40 family metallo-hydrolase [Bryobacteraceae bacterium]|nr:M20/M25/M40 family metallo-hydrolase [Acidobacteriaceae bacterium]
MNRLTLAIALFLFPYFAHAADPKTTMQQPAVAEALRFAQSNAEANIETQIHLCEIAAPEFHEEKRAAAVEELFKAAHLQNIHTDPAGNLIGDRPGKNPHPHIVIAAHLDTVFPEGTDVHVTRNGNVLKGPGIYDDCRGLAALVGVAQALDAGKVQTTGAITFVADTGEEGLGDLRGMKEFFRDKSIFPGVSCRASASMGVFRNENAAAHHFRDTEQQGKCSKSKSDIDAFISIDGPEPITDAITGGVGSYRLRLTYSGPGGHSFNAFGIANPIHALGRAIAKIDEIQTPETPRTTFNVGRIGGGTSVNTISSSAFAEIDMRSEESGALETTKAAVERAAQSALDEENARWHDHGKLTMKIDLLGYRPTGSTPSNSMLVDTVRGVNQAMGLSALTTSRQSTDSNFPMSLGIPSITLGAGGTGKDAHTVNETIDITDAWKGVQRLVLAVSTLAGW